jgi:transposase InsO family protein
MFQITMNKIHFLYRPRDKYDLIRAVHNELAGHHGVERTLAKLRVQKHDWLYMREHIKWFIKHCPLCQKLSYENILTKTQPFTVSRYEPMECLNIDSIGPMPDEWYMLVIIDCFTRFIELYAVPNTTALEAARCLLEHFGRYGCPAQIRSDRGTQFANDTIEEFLKLVGTEHLLTVPYSSQHNAIVERSNKEVMRHLRAIIFEKNIIDGWRNSLPLVQRIIYPVNSYVLVDYHNKPPSKLHTNSKGPLRVVSFDKSIYVLQGLVTNRQQNIHVSNLRPFIFDPNVTDPRLVANAHTGHPRNKKSMTFVVQWVGYEPDDTTVQSWADLRDNVKFHELMKHNFGKYISKKFIMPPNPEDVHQPLQNNINDFQSNDISNESSDDGPSRMDIDTENDVMGSL